MIFFYLFTLHFKVLSNLDTFADRRTLDLTKDTFAYQRTLNLTNNPSILQRVLNILLDTAQLLNSHKYERSQKN